MDELRAHRQARRLRCDAFQATLHCSDEHRNLVAWALEAWKAGDLPLNDAVHIVSTVRRNYQQQAA